MSTEDFEGATFNVTTGDYSELLKLVTQNLNRAMEYVANEEERRMLYDYVKSFTEGSIDAHKDGSRHWIRNKSPAVETYIGFIENYRCRLHRTLATQLHTRTVSAVPTEIQQV